MTRSDRELSPSSISRTPLEEEQSLCNEALRTGAFDVISDKEWVALCERVAKDSKGRPETESDGLDEAIFVR